MTDITEPYVPIPDDELEPDERLNVPAGVLKVVRDWLNGTGSGS